MSETTASLAVAMCSGLAALIALGAVMGTVKRREWNLAAYLSLGLALMTFSILNLIVTYTGTWVTITDVFNTVTHDVPGWGHSLLRVTLAAQGVAAAGLFLLRLRRKDILISVPSVFLLIVALISIGSAFLNGDHPLRPFTVIYALTLLACTVAPRGLGIHLGIAVSSLIEAIASGLAMWLHPDIAIVECRAGYKCGLLGFNLQGIMDNENALALSLALALPFVFMAFRGWPGTLLSLYVVGIVVLTGSRSGSIAAIVTLVVLLVIRPDARRPDRAPGRSLLLALGVLPVIVVSAALPFFVRDPEAFSGRAALWNIARQSLSHLGTLVHGTGVFGWDHERQSGKIDASEVYSVHNQWLEVAYSTGLVGLAFFVAAIGVLLWQARNTYFTVVCSVLVPVAVLSITERPWPVDTADWLTWAVPGALLCYPIARPNPVARPQRVETREEVLVS